MRFTYTGVNRSYNKQTDSSVCTGSVSVTGSDVGSFKGSQHLGRVLPPLNVNLRTLHHVFYTLGLRLGFSKFLSSLMGDESASVLNKAKIPRIFLHPCQRFRTADAMSSGTMSKERRSLSSWTSAD